MLAYIAQTTVEVLNGGEMAAAMLLISRRAGVLANHKVRNCANHPAGGLSALFGPVDCCQSETNGRDLPELSPEQMKQIVTANDALYLRKLLTSPNRDCALPEICFMFPSGQGRSLSLICRQNPHFRTKSPATAMTISKKKESCVAPLPLSGTCGTGSRVLTFCSSATCGRLGGDSANQID